jgi:uncharacterized protein (TIGR02145 family)
MRQIILFFILFSTNHYFCQKRILALNFNNQKENKALVGSQIWMTENLNVERFQNGDLIPEAKTEEDWAIAREKKLPAWCYYNNDTINGTKYGKLYNWYAINDPRGLAPKGWHIPTESEIWTLADFLGFSFGGNKLKSQSGWFDCNKSLSSLDYNGNNSFGFNALPSGMRSSYGDFETLGCIGYWWSASSKDNINEHYLANYFKIRFDDRDLYFYDDSKGCGLAVRCILDYNSFDYIPVVKIGSQSWSSKNLSVNTFRNGDSIPEVKTEEEWLKAALNKTPAWCYYENNPKNDEKYGKLYNWYAINDPRGLLPKGWHVPSKKDWLDLIDTLGANLEMKLKNTQGWDIFDYPSNNGSNQSGFSAMPGGCRNYNGIFPDSQQFSSSSWWSSSEENDLVPCFFLHEFSGINTVEKSVGMYVRFVKD